MDNKTTAIQSSESRRGLMRKDFINKALLVEDAIGQLPDVKVGDELGTLRHRFADGLYIREITMPKGFVLTSKIHKTTHPYFVLKGDVSVKTEEGDIRIKAPYSGITQAGTKRILFCHEETVWVTVHSTTETDLKRIERELIAQNYDELPEHVKDGTADNLEEPLNVSDIKLISQKEVSV